MMAPNPYNCTQAGNLFVGYQHERDVIVGGLRGGKSFAVVGGRRCGKTSLLLQLQDDLLSRAGAEPIMVPRLIDMQGFVPRGPHDFFKALEAAVSQGLALGPWNPPPAESAYQAFLARLKQIEGNLRDAYGQRWIIVLLLDELDAAARSLGSDECFQNLRNLLSVSEHRASFRVVGAGVNGLVDLIKHGSPLNILEKQFTRALSAAEAEQLAGPAYAQGHSGSDVRDVLRLAGGHAFVLQALLSYLWDLPPALQPPQRVQQARGQFARDRLEVLRRWVADLGGGGRSVYEKLLSAEGGALPEAELRRRLPGGSVSDGLRALAFHGVIDDAQDPPRISCHLFREWYLSETPEGEEPSPDLPDRGTRPTRVFVVSGRNRKAHAATCAFLRALKLEPLEWSRVVNMTDKATPSAREVLDKAFELAIAVVVLFTPDDEARLAAAHRKTIDPDFEGELTQQPRQNVLFEAGMAMALFPERTILVQVGKIRPMSDLAGLQFIRMDGSFEARQELLGRLETRCAVDADSTAWHTAGDFSL